MPEESDLLLPPDPSRSILGQDQQTTCILRDDDGASESRAGVPLLGWVIIIVEMCERFAFLGLLGPLQNYMQNSDHDPSRPPGLGFTQANATRLNQFFTIWTYATPLLGAVLADQYLGRVKTILIACVVYLIGLIALYCSSLVVSSSHDASLAGLLVGMILLGVGGGGIKPNISPLLFEQYRGPAGGVQDTPNNDDEYNKVIQRMSMFFYWGIQLGSFSSIATSLLEQKHGFSAAFAVPLFAFLVGSLVFSTISSRLYTTETNDSTLIKALQYTRNNLRVRALKNNYRTPANIETTSRADLDDDVFNDSMTKVLRACRPFVFICIFYMAYINMNTSFVSQAKTMETHNVPNDLIVITNPLTVIILTPVLEKFVLPACRKFGFPLLPFTRMMIGFFLMAVAMAYASCLQVFIYKAPPCFDHPLAIDCEGGVVPNQIHVATQMPAYFLVGLSEMFMVPASYEYVFGASPASMKSLVMALYLLTAAIGVGLALLVTPLAVDPYLPWMYLVLSVASALSGISFWSFLILRRGK